MADRVVKVTLTAQVAGYLKGMEDAKRATDNTTKTAESRLRDQEAAFKELGGTAVKVGAVTTAALGLAAKAAIDWESAWTGVLKTVDGTPEQLERVENGLRALARELPASHTEIAAVAEAAGQLGIETDNVVAFTKTMIDLGETTNMSAEEAATSLARFSNIMGTSQKDVGRLGAAIVGLGNNYATTEGEIVAMSMRLAGAGRQIGLTEGSVLGLATAMSSVGIEAEAGGTAMSLTMKRIAKEVETGGENLELFARVAGMSAGDFAKAWQDDAAGALAVFIKGLADTEKLGMSTNQVLTELGVTGIRESDALLRLSSAHQVLNGALSQGNEEYAKNTALLEEAEKRYQTVEARLKASMNAINDAAIDFGSVLMPVIQGAAERVADFAGDVASLPEPLKVATVAGAGLVSTVGLLGGGFLLLLPKIQATRAALATMGPIGARIGTSLKGVGVAAAGVVAVGLAQEFRQWASEMSGARKSADSLRQSLKEGANVATTVTDALTTKTGSAAENLKLLGSDFGQFMADLQGSFMGTVLEISSFGLADTALSDARENLRALDETMASLVSSGNTELATRMWLQLTRQAEEAGMSVDELKKLLPEYSEAQYDAARATGDAAGAAETNKRSLSDLAGQAGATQYAIAGLSDELRDFGNTTFTVIDAEQRFQQALRDVTDRLGEDGFKGGLDLATEAGSRNMDILQEVARSTNEFAAATYDSTGSVKEMERVLAGGRAALIETARKFGVSEEAAAAYADQLIATPDVVQTRVVLEGAEAAANSLRGLRQVIRDVDGSVVQVRAGTTIAHADGGAVYGPGGPRDDRVPAWLSNGEHVLTAREVDLMGGQGAVYRFRESLRSGVRYAEGGAVGSYASYSPASTAPQFNVVVQSRGGIDLTKYIDVQVERADQRNSLTYSMGKKVL